MYTESPPPSESTDSGFDNSPKSNRDTIVTNTSDRSTEESVDEKVNGNDVTLVTCDKNETNGVAMPSGGQTPSHRRPGIPSRLRQHFRSLFKGRVTLQEEGEIGITPKDIAYKKLMHKIMQEQGNSFSFHPHVLEHSLSDPSIEGFAVREFPQSSRTRFASTDHAPRRSDSCSLPAGCDKSRIHAFLAQGESETDIFVAHGESETNVFLGQGESETDVLLAQGESETNTFMAQGESETITSMAQGESETNTFMAQGERETDIFVAQNESETDGDGINVKIHQSENDNCDDDNQINISRTYQKDLDQYQEDGSALSVVNSLSDIKTATVFHGGWNGNGVCEGSDVETGDQTIYGEQNCSDDVFDTPNIVLEHDIALGKCAKNGESLSQAESTRRLCESYHDETTIQTILSTAQTLAVTKHSVLISAPASPHSTGSSWGDSSDMSCGGDMSCVGDNDDAIGNAANNVIAADISEDDTVGCQDDVTESVTNDIGMSQVDVSNGVINSDDGIGSDDDSIRVSNERDTIAGDVNNCDRTTGVLARHNVSSLVRCDSQPSDDNEWARTTEQAIEAIQTQVLKGVSNLPDAYRGNHQVVLKGVSHHQLNGNRIANSRLSSTSSDIYSESSTDDDTGDSFLNTVTSARTADNPTDDDMQGAVDNGRDHPLDGADTSDTFKRFYHVFREGELGELIEKHVDCLDVLSAYYDHANWCVIAEKVQVWKIWYVFSTLRIGCFCSQNPNKRRVFLLSLHIKMSSLCHIIMYAKITPNLECPCTAAGAGRGGGLELMQNTGLVGLCRLMGRHGTVWL